MFAPPIPGGANQQGFCTNPRSDISGYEISYGGSCNPAAISQADACLDGQAGIPGPDFFPGAVMIQQFGRYYVPDIHAWRYQALRADCYPDPFTTNPMRPHVYPARNPRSVTITMPGPARDALLGRGLPHGRTVGPMRGENDVINVERGVQVDVRTDAGGRTRVDYDTPPRPSTNTRLQDREVKSKTKAMAGAMMRLMGSWSEARDGIEQLWKALPARLRRAGARDTFGQLQELIRNSSSINWADAARNLAMNEMEDQIIGRAHGLLGRGYAREISRQLEYNQSYYHNRGRHYANRVRARRTRASKYDTFRRKEWS